MASEVVDAGSCSGREVSENYSLEDMCGYFKLKPSVSHAHWFNMHCKVHRHPILG